MILPRYVVLGVMLASLASTSAMADDTMVDGKPCNELCRSWLGVKSPEARPLPAHSVAAPVPPVPVTKPRQADLKVKPARALAATAPVPSKPAAEPARVLPTAGPAPAQRASSPPAALSGTTPAPALVDPANQDDGALADMPDATDGAGPPQPDKIVAVRGSVMVESASERAANQQLKARLTNEMTRSAILP